MWFTTLTGTKELSSIAPKKSTMPTQTNCRSQFTAYLRNHRIPYTTSPSCVHFYGFTLTFQDNDETVVFQSVIFPRIKLEVPFASPDTLLRKFHNFKSLVVKLSLQVGRTTTSIGLS